MNRRDFISKSIPASGVLAYQGSAPFLQGNEAKSNVVNGFTYELPKFKNGARLLFQGDSITDMNWGRNQKDRNHYLGHSYVFLLASRLGVEMPHANLEFFNRGVSGNKVSDLRKRWHKDAIEMNPDWLSILVGVNDVSQGRGQPIDLKKWEGDFRHILNESRRINPDLNIVLMDPFVLRMTRLSPDDQWRYWRGEIDKLGQIVSRMAKDFDAVHIETQKIFDQAARYASSQHWIWDGVHPLPQGHELIARNWLQAVAKATNK